MTGPVNDVDHAQFHRRLFGILLILAVVIVVVSLLQAGHSDDPLPRDSGTSTIATTIGP